MKKISTFFFTVFISLTMVMAQAWEWRNPLPQGNRINDVHAFDQNNVVAVGANGTIMVSAGGGATWNVSKLDTDKWIYSVHFLDQNTGYCALAGGDIYYTSNGGTDWSLTSRPSFSNDITDVWALTATDVLCITYNGDIFMSNDNGSNWTQKTNPGSGATYLNKIYFLDANIGFIVGGNNGYNRSEIFKTVDGGGTWTLVSSPVEKELRDIVFTDASNGFIAGKGGVLLETSNCGDSWSVCTNTESFFTDFNALWFFDSNNGVAAGEHRIFYTSDGGSNWNEGFYKYGINPLALFSTGADQIMGLGADGLEIRSENKGMAWSVPADVTYEIFRDISFIGNTGYAVSDDASEGFVFKTADGGANWTPIHGAGRYQSVEAISGNHVVVAQSNRIEVTTDGGVNWNTTYNSSSSLYDIVVGDASVLYGIGFGIVVKSTDGGINWSELTSPTSNALTSGFFFDANTGFIVSGSYGTGEVFKTTDGGTNWSPVTIPVTNKSLNDIYFISADKGFIGGQDQLLLKTIDGGVTWTEADLNIEWSSTTDDLRSIDFADAQNGMIVGYKGLMAMTQDGGDTWSLVDPLPTDQFLNAVAFSDDYIVAGGNGGALLTYPLSAGDEANTVSDIDGNVYNTVTIGNQVWMAENLKVTQLNDGTALPNNEGAAWTTDASPAYCWYNDDITYKDIYGALYNWYAVATNKLCPEGWHVPTRDEWNALEAYLDPAGSDDIAGAKMKSTRTAPDAHPRWDSPNEGATNESGFSALPGGFRAVTSGFDYVGNHGRWWTSSELDTNPSKAIYRNIYHNLVRLGQSNLTKELGFSVRCIQGTSSEITSPTVTTTAASNVATTSATSGGEVTKNGGDAVTTRGVVWSTSENPTVDINEGITIDGSGIGTFTSNLTGLTAGSTYYVRAYAANSVGVGYGNQVSFSSQSETGGTEILMQNGSVSVSTGVFYDTGGADGNYASNSDFTFTLNPAESGKMVKLSFSMFNIEPSETCSWDYMQIYDGADTSAPLIGTYCGTNSPGEITSTHSSGALTIVFRSDASLEYSGWEADISLVTGISDGGSITETEPNDEYTTADSFPINGEASGNIGENSDEYDWYTFTTPNDGKVVFAANPESTLDLQMLLFESDGTTTIGANHQDGNAGVNDTLTHTNLKAGTYYVRVNRFQSTYGSYILENIFTPTELAEGNDSEPNDTYGEALSLAVDGTVTGHIGYYGSGTFDEYDWYTFTTPYDGKVVFAADPESTLDLQMLLYESDGTTSIGAAWQDGNPGVNDTLTHTNLKAGTYYVRVNRFQSTYGSYTLENIFTPTELAEGNDSEPNDTYGEALSLAIDGTVTGHIGYFGNGTFDEYDWYTFTTPNDGKVVFAANPESTLDLQMLLYESDGTTSISGNWQDGSAGVNDTLTHTDLKAGTYYLRVNRFQSTYGSYTLQNIFTFSGQEEMPVVSTTSVTSITASSAVSGGNVASDGGVDVTARGVVWSTSTNPTVESNTGITVDSSGVGAFTSNITGMLAETTYYVRAYATNSVGTAYGNEVEFTTGAASGGEDQEISLGDGTATGKYLPVAPFWGYSYAQTIYKQSEINVQGQITQISYYYNGNSSWTDAIDIYMGITDKSSFASTTDWVSVNNMTLVYSGSLSVTTTEGWVTITLDTPFDYNNTQNLVVAVDENTDGYHSVSDNFYCTEMPGESRSLAFVSDSNNPDPANPPAGEDFSGWNPDFMPNTKFLITTGGNGDGETNVVDKDGNIYETVEIGQQVWMSANLRVTQFNDGTPIDNEVDNTQWGERFAEPLWSLYNNDPSLDAVYGKLYNGMVVTNSKNVCPEGWKVPTKEDWENLIAFLGGSEIAGGKMKITGTEYWDSPNTDATNTSGLSMVPGGVRDGFGDFFLLGKYGWYWTLTPVEGSSSAYNTFAVELNNNWAHVNIDEFSNSRGFSVRCIKSVGTSVPQIQRSIETLDYYLLENTLYLKDVEDKALVSIVDISGRMVYFNNIKSVDDSDVMVTTLKPGISVVNVIEDDIVKRAKILVNP